jgi:tetratricopeptide (TPR) repeat protein
MDKRPDSFLRFLGSTFISTQGIIIDSFGLFFGLILWAFAAGDSISLRIGLLVLVPCLVLITTLLTASYNLFRICKHGLPKVCKVKPYSPDKEDTSLLFLLEPSELFPQGIQASVFYYDDNIEQIIGLGTVVNIQEDGYVQVATTRLFEGYDEVLNDLRTKKNFDLNRIKVKPVVPQFVPAPIQKHLIVETKLDNSSQDALPLTEPSAKEIAAPPIQETEAKAEKMEENLPVQPKASTDLRREMIAAFASRNRQKAKELLEQIQERESDVKKRLQAKAIYYQKLYESGNSSAIKELRQLTERTEIAADAHFRLGLCYEATGDYEMAVKEYEMSAQLEVEEYDKALAITFAADSLFLSGQQEDAIKRLIDGLTFFKDDSAISELYESLADLYKSAGQFNLQSIALEKAISISPNNAQLRFAAGYCYSKIKFRNISLLHYKYNVQFSHSSAAGYNNIGVEYNGLGMKIRAVDSFKKATTLDNTLAAANLAERYLGSGFADDALQILNKAQQQPNLHSKVGIVFISLTQAKEKEAEMEEAVINKAREQQKFMLAFADAYFLESLEQPDFAGTWHISDGTVVSITQIKDFIEATWTKTYNYKFSGKVNNKAATITTYIEKGFPTKKYEATGQGYVYLSSDRQQIFFLALVNESGTPQYSSLLLIKLEEEKTAEGSDNE